MVRSIQRWGPNTCGCKILQEHGDDLPVVYKTREEAQVIVDAITTRERRVRKIQPESVLCSAHVVLGHTDVMYRAVLAENQTWNRTLSAIMGFLPDITVDQYIQATNEHTVEGGRVNYDVDRVLQVDTSRLVLTGRDRIDIQDAVNLQFGSDKVLIV